MIPKIIHYCWFGRNPKPRDVLEYIETWKKYLPEYEIKEWNETNFDYKRLRYTREAHIAKKFAFVSDVCRLQALYYEGGIYFDTDIEVIKPFTEFENLQSFIGYEVNELLGTGVIGSVPHMEWIKMMLDQYNDEHFIGYDGRYNLNPNTIRLTELLQKLPLHKYPSIYPLDVFCAKDWKTKEEYITEKTVSIHHYKSSWTICDVHPYEEFEQRLCSKLHLKNRHIIIRLCKKYFW